MRTFYRLYYLPDIYSTLPKPLLEMRRMVDALSFHKKTFL